MRRIRTAFGLVWACAVIVLPGVAGDEPVQPENTPPEKKSAASGLVPLDEKGVVWLDNRDPKKRRVMLKAKVVLREGWLEMLCCLTGTKEHESILAVDTKAFVVHTALIAAGAKPGKPVQFHPEYRPASGQQIDVSLEWRDEKGKLQQVRAQEWVRNVETGKPLMHPWVFAGSGFFEDAARGERYYLAEDGDLICVANFPSATLDLAVRSSADSGELLFEAFTDRIPKLQTPVTIYLEPVPEKKSES